MSFERIEIMAMGNHVNVKHCLFCSGATEFYCYSCRKDICSKCKEKHVFHLNHKVTIYREKFKHLLKQEKCLRHPNGYYENYCESCEVPVFNCACVQHRIPILNHTFSIQHNGHTLTDIKTVYQNKRQQFKDYIYPILNQNIYMCLVLLAEIQSDFKSIQTKKDRCQSQIAIESQNLKTILETLPLEGIVCSLPYVNQLEEENLKLENALRSKGQVASIKLYKAATFPLALIAHNPVKRCIQSNNMGHLIQELGTINISKVNKSRLENCVPKMISSPLLEKIWTMRGIDGCVHISRVTPNWVWVSDGNNMILKDTNSNLTVNHVYDSVYFNFRSYQFGFYTVNNEGRLIYIDKDHNIKILSLDMTKTNTFIRTRRLKWLPQCVSCSPQSGHLLVSMKRCKTHTGIIHRYDSTGRLIQRIEQKEDPTGELLYPLYIAENNNGDIIVSYLLPGVVVVVDRRGKHRFSYTGPPPRLRKYPLSPRGICTDALSHILVCDWNTDTVQMIDKNGQFLKYLLKKNAYETPVTLSYDFNNHNLWVGSQFSSTVCVYKYMQHHPTMEDMSENWDASSSHD